jgi:hypothetical protein
MILLLSLNCWAEPAEHLPIPVPGSEIQGKPYPEFQSEKVHPVWEWTMPFLAQRVIDKGFSLPRPYGVSLVYTHLQQGLDIGDLHVAFDDSKPLRDIDFVNLAGAEVNNNTAQLKVDSWILPFLNAFLLLGTVEGSGNVPIAISAKEFYDDIDTSICAAPAPNFCDGYISASAPIKYHGVNYGLGLLVAGGFKDFFFAMPITYVITDVNVSTSNGTSLNLIPRFGYNIKTLHSGKFGVYLGANYLESNMEMEGTYTLPMASSPIGRDVDVRYRIHENPLDKWNAVTGVNWELSEFWSIVAELGFGTNRQMQTFNFSYRF